MAGGVFVGIGADAAGWETVVLGNGYWLTPASPIAPTDTTAVDQISERTAENAGIKGETRACTRA